MAKFWESTTGYIILHEYAMACLRMSFSSLKRENLEKLPDFNSNVVIFAPNHCAAMVDPLMILQTRRHAPVAFGARSDIFANPRTAKILRWLRILPIARERNGLQEVAKNYATFDEAIVCMDHGTPFCMFAEGTHRAERGMMPVKKGVFRIAKMAMERIDKPVYVVPVGLDYEYFFQEIGRAVLRIGDPINVSRFFRENSERTDAENYHQLCGILQERDMALIDSFVDRKHGNVALGLLLGLLALPVFIVSGLLSFPIWLPSVIIMSTMEDKAWTHTVNYAFRFFFPVLWPFNWLAGVIYNFYTELFQDIKK
ncbi:MAG: 1-acyl-sn-glycerol-3-phosphate acyltransferase [Bacteroidales bacterium]|nr:1-acyl-sn-glycerol-3-phosphate acyltransferase [Bacteroidales bacterium]